MNREKSGDHNDVGNVAFALKGKVLEIVKVKVISTCGRRLSNDCVYTEAPCLADYMSVYGIGKWEHGTVELCKLTAGADLTVVAR